ncbi:hypothetical protein [Microbispora siamensis]|uniref:Uncharacterized protein n=1 Tax=Microbispora siamensis TaxID=564413 RepID=A0ABQ4GEX2_9ACTN|nr:hypothetical protein [Microbispora siamensis]GIH59972.1 hypothetical protein Msi02_07890 [Microbispora siamensis]
MLREAASEADDVIPQRAGCRPEEAAVAPARRGVRASVVRLAPAVHSACAAAAAQTPAVRLPLPLPCCGGTGLPLKSR